MKKLLVLTALASALCLPALAQNQGGNSQGGNNNNQGGNNNNQGGGGYRGAPGPVAGEGLPFVVLGAAGFGAYWLVRRTRRKYQ